MESIEKKYTTVFGSKEGKEVLKDLLLFCNHNKMKPSETEFLHRIIGREDVALHILARLETKKDESNLTQYIHEEF